MKNRLQTSDGGFSLIETVVAMGILATALMTLGGVFVIGLRSLGNSSPGLIAREKAREAIESVHTARDTQVLVWDQIRNAPEGVFLAGARQLRLPGDDGLVNTGDDGALEEQRSPGYDGVLGTADDAITALDAYSREIQITDVLDADGNIDQNLRQVRIVVRYNVAGEWKTYTLTTLISRFA